MPRTGGSASPASSTRHERSTRLRGIPARSRARPERRSRASAGCMTAIDLAAAVRGGRSAVAVAEEHIALVRAREDELHACNLVTDDAARAAAAAVDEAVARGDDPGP